MDAVECILMFAYINTKTLWKDTKKPNKSGFCAWGWRVGGMVGDKGWKGKFHLFFILFHFILEPNFRTIQKLEWKNTCDYNPWKQS